MLHNEARKLLAEAYEQTRAVYRLSMQMKKTGSAELQTSQRTSFRVENVGFTWHKIKAARIRIIPDAFCYSVSDRTFIADYRLSSVYSSMGSKSGKCSFL